MKEPMVITMAREYASGGSEIAQAVADKLGIPLYNKELITLAAKKSGLTEEAIAASENQRSGSLIYSLYMMGNTMPLADQVYILQSNVIKELAAEGPCVILGRCGDYVLRERKDVLRVFIYAPVEWRRELAKTDPLGADVPNPVSHVAYGYATQMCILDRETGMIKKMVAAHDVGKAVNPLSIEGQIEGGVVMSMGSALTAQYPIDANCKPTAKYGTLGLFRANQLPEQEIEAIVVEKPGLDVAGGAIGIGEITSIPTAPAIADAYYRLDGERRLALPLTNTPYARKK